MVTNSALLSDDSVLTQDMDKVTTRFYLDGYKSPGNAINPYCAKSQILPYHAWNAGFIDKHGRAPYQVKQWKYTS